MTPRRSDAPGGTSAGFFPAARSTSTLGSAVLAWLCVSASASAQPEAPAPQLEPEQQITGKEITETESGDAGRDVANALLWLPRNIIDLVFKGTTVAATTIADQQLVPRYQKALGAPPGGDIFLFPTLFVDTGSAFSVGARAIVDTEYVTTTQLIGFGGLSDVEAETRVIFKGSDIVPATLSMELYYQLEDDIEYEGIGIVPSRDTRNRFNPTNALTVGAYTQTQTRAITSLGWRLSDDLELFISSSLGRRQIASTVDAGAGALDEVFEPGSIFGARRDIWMSYSEGAVRFDSRVSRAKPTPGALVETYAGGGENLGVAGDVDVSFLRLGGRVAGFFPIYRRTNILSPRIVLDRITALNSLPLPFYALSRQPDFRGFDTRRDNLSLVASLDYTWQLVPFMGLRMFADAATVAPSFAEFSLHHVENMRWAGGLGVDFFTDTARLARIQVAGSPDGVRLHFSVGTLTGFGDRQHRE